jgi:thiol-disulfide isomerase/thioredoxin
MKPTTVPRIPLLLLLLAAPACGPEAPPPAAEGGPLVGTWRAVLLSPGGDLPFGLEITRRGSELEAVAVSGSERAPFSTVELDGADVTLAFDHYDSRIEARLEDERMTGRWWKTVPGGISSLEFAATRGAAERFTPVDPPAPPAPFADLSGAWRVEFVDEDGSEPARGEFYQQGKRVTGTFLTPTGDYRFLEGSFEAGLLRLSTFDGGHAFLFHARARADGGLEGDFWSRDTYHARWTAVRAVDGEPILPDAWGLAGLTNDDGRFRFAFEDLEGRLLSSDDPRFRKKVVLANIFGSWCPNCNDEAPLLAEWDRRYRDRGLEIVGLAYEYSGHRERDRRYVRKYAERHGIAFPLLLAGISDKAAAAETLPDLSAVIAFPTSVFIGRDGRVRRIHSGFSGPGTGEHYEKLVAELETLIETLLAEPAPA